MCLRNAPIYASGCAPPQRIHHQKAHFPTLAHQTHLARCISSVYMYHVIVLLTETVDRQLVSALVVVVYGRSSSSYLPGVLTACWSVRGEPRVTRHLSRRLEVPTGCYAGEFHRRGDLTCGVDFSGSWKILSGVFSERGNWLICHWLIIIINYWWLIVTVIVN